MKSTCRAIFRWILGFAAGWCFNYGLNYCFPNPVSATIVRAVEAPVEVTVNLTRRLWHVAKRTERRDERSNHH